MFVCCCLLAMQGLSALHGQEPAPLVSFVVALGVFSHWSMVGTVSCRKQPQQQPQNSSFSFCLSLFFFFSVTNLPPYLPHSQPSMSSFCLRNLLFFLCFSLSYYFHLLSPWPQRPPVSVCIHHLSGLIWLVLIKSSVKLYH